MRTSIFFITVLFTAAVVVGSIGVLLDVASSASVSLMVKDQYEGMKIYADKCASCHGKDGSGATTRGKAMKVPDLRAPGLQKKDDNELFDAIVKSPAHRGLQKQLGDDNLRMVVMHTRTLKK
jgi:mono/diheme cytochrome c family protein